MEPRWPQYFQPGVVKEALGSKLSSYVIALEAWRRGLTVVALDPKFRKIRIGDGRGREVTFIGSRPTLTTNSASLSVKNKYETARRLQEAGIPAPNSILIDPQICSAKELSDYARELGFPVVLKPRDGARGKDVFAGIESSEVLESRYDYLVQKSPTESLVLENHIQGADYRVLVFGGHYIAACKRVPANVMGDGWSTIDELIEAKNNHRKRNPFLSSGLIKRDQEVTDYLCGQGYDYTSVPRDGEYLRLRGAANASAGGDVIDATEALPASIRKSAVRAAKTIPGLYCTGVDVLWDESSSGADSYAILELNGLPQIGVNMYPTHGNGVDVPRKFIDICFPEVEHPGIESDARLRLSLGAILQSLESGHASEVKLAPLPPGRYRTRRLYELEVLSHLSQGRRRKILKMARDHSVAGFLRNRTQATQVLVAGTLDDIGSFAKALSSVAGVEMLSSRPWRGSVPSGFTVEI